MTKVDGALAERLAFKEQEESNDAKRARNAQLKKNLEREEEKREPGIGPRTVKLQTLDTTRFAAIFKGRKARYVATDKLDSREVDGWVRVSEDDAKKARLKTTLGSQYVLMEISQKKVDTRRAALDKRNRDLLEATRGQFKAEVAKAQRELAAQGVIPDDKSLLSDESDGGPQEKKELDG